MSIRELGSSRVSVNLFTFCVFLSCFPGLILSAIVTLDSIVIYNTHELIKAVKPRVYFECRGENKTEFPDVKEKNVTYKFNGEESWQPLTEFSGKKCKRCGLYEADTFKPDDKFDEWELCPSDFNDSDGKYVRFNDKEFNLTFWCPKCVPGEGKAYCSNTFNRCSCFSILYCRWLCCIQVLAKEEERARSGSVPKAV
ncbi:unnamed protein product [Malus baccata var. baccata]